MNPKLLTFSALALLAAAALPQRSHAQDQTSGDDARPMTQRLCEKSPGPCAQMQQRHEQCQEHPRDCAGVTAAPAPQRQPASAAPASSHARTHRHAPSSARSTSMNKAARKRACEADPKRCSR